MKRSLSGRVLFILWNSLIQTHKEEAKASLIHSQIKHTHSRSFFWSRQTMFGLVLQLVSWPLANFVWSKFTLPKSDSTWNMCLRSCAFFFLGCKPFHRSALFSIHFGCAAVVALFYFLLDEVKWKLLLWNEPTNADNPLVLNDESFVTYDAPYGEKLSTNSNEHRRPPINQFLLNAILDPSKLNKESRKIQTFSCVCATLWHFISALKLKLHFLFMEIAKKKQRRTFL